MKLPPKLRAVPPIERIDGGFGEHAARKVRLDSVGRDTKVGSQLAFFACALVISAVILGPLLVFAWACSNHPSKILPPDSFSLRQWATAVLAHVLFSGVM